MIINLINSNIIHFQADTRYELCSTFIRMQEFYESPFEEFRGKYFTMDAYMDRYAQSNGDKFTYFEDWAGFNIPGESLVHFWNTYTVIARLRDKEYKVFDAIKENINYDQKFYVIGTHGVDELTLNHEIRHARYYLEDDYRNKCQEIYKQLPEKVKKSVNKRLTEYGYDSSVFPDETQAYFGSEDNASLQEKFRIKTDLSPWVEQYSALN